MNDVFIRDGKEENKRGTGEKAMWRCRLGLELGQ